ncbi:MAG: type II toxin-antitoxin system HicB family antitoxin [Patescibacteria group bacterium]
MRSYNFQVVIEPDEDRWFAYCPALKDHAATTWGYTYEEAHKNIQEVVQMIIRGLKRDGICIPEGSVEEVSLTREPKVMALL